MHYFRNLSSNVRFYILVASLLVSVMVLCGLRLLVPSDQLLWIRSQQVYGLLAVVLLYVAVILTPVSKLFTTKPSWLQLLLFARRAIGVSAAYFATLHTAIVIFQQVGGWSGLVLLPFRFKVAFIIGGVALVILLLMAVTSFDKVIKWMTFPRWKRLHQFVYLAGVVIIVHVWMIGTHASYAGVRAASLSAISLLLGLEAMRIAKLLTAKYKLNMQSQVAIVALVFGVMLGALFSLPLLTPNYHNQHQAQHEAQQ